MLNGNDQSETNAMLATLIEYLSTQYPTQFRSGQLAKQGCRVRHPWYAGLSFANNCQSETLRHMKSRAQHLLPSLLLLLALIGYVAAGSQGDDESAVSATVSGVDANHL